MYVWKTKKYTDADVVVDVWRLTQLGDLLLNT